MVVYTYNPNTGRWRQEDQKFTSSLPTIFLSGYQWFCKAHFCESALITVSKIIHTLETMVRYDINRSRSVYVYCKKPTNIFVSVCQTQRRMCQEYLSQSVVHKQSHHWPTWKAITAGLWFLWSTTEPTTALLCPEQEESTERSSFISIAFVMSTL